MITKAVVRDAQQGDRDARQQIAQECHELFMRVLRRRRVDPEACEDLSQQALEIVMRKLPEFRWRARLESWALAILFNCHLRYLQKEKLAGERTVSQAEEGPAPVDLIADSPGSDPFWQVFRKQLGEALAECLSRISLTMREVWIQHRLMGKEYQTIANELQLNINTVSTRIFRVDARLRQCLEAKNYTPATLAVAG